MTYFKRATVYLALGKSKSALPDLDKVIELKPDFNSVSISLVVSSHQLAALDENCLGLVHIRH